MTAPATRAKPTRVPMPLVLRITFGSWAFDITAVILLVLGILEARSFTSAKG